jgi:hypothetical protein
MPAPAISIVIVSYNMAREVPRTVFSLSRGYQRLDATGPCEVLLIDNGSTPPPRREDFGPDVDLAIHHWPDPTPSPVPALNSGLRQARGALVGVWIDGARLASPGLVQACAQAAALHPRAIVVTENRHLGPRAQPLSCLDGYDQAREDALLATVDWRRDGYGLFGISVSVDGTARGEPMLESNAIFMRRELWDELGGYDPAFDSPGGGAVNPDLLIRACERPGTQLIRVVGEATFHQFHGGVTSSDPERNRRVLIDCSREYYRIRRRALRPVRDPGWMFDARSGTLRTAPTAL